MKMVAHQTPRDNNDMLLRENLLKFLQQEKPVIIHHLIAEGTADEQVMRALQDKDTSQAALLAALKERRMQ